MPRRVIGSYIFLVTACGLLGGCTTTAHHSAAMGVLGKPRIIMTLGAGDQLGRSVYVNDLILASGGRPAEGDLAGFDEHLRLPLDE